MKGILIRLIKIICIPLWIIVMVTVFFIIEPLTEVVRYILNGNTNDQSFVNSKMTEKLFDYFD